MPHLSAMLVPNPDKIPYSSPSMLPEINSSAGLEDKGGVSFPGAVYSLLKERCLSASIVIVDRPLKMSKILESKAVKSYVWKAHRVMGSSGILEKCTDIWVEVFGSVQTKYTLLIAV